MKQEKQANNKVHNKKGGETSAGKGRIKISVIGTKIMGLTLNKVLGFLKAIGWSRE